MQTRKSTIGFIHLPAINLFLALANLNMPLFRNNTVVFSDVNFHI